MMNDLNYFIFQYLYHHVQMVSHVLGGLWVCTMGEIRVLVEHQLKAERYDKECQAVGYERLTCASRSDVADAPRKG